VDETGGERPDLPVETPAAVDSAPAAEEPDEGPDRSEYADQVGAAIEADDPGPVEPDGADLARTEAVAMGERQLHAASQADELADQAGEGDDPGGPARTAEDLYAWGGSKDDGFPRPPRPKDFGVESLDETVGPYDPTAPTDEVRGGSTYATVEQGQAEGLTRQVFRLPEGSELPPGMAVHADGRDAGGAEPDGHRTLYPTDKTPLGEFRSSWSHELSWVHHGKVDDKTGEFIPAQDEPPG
jgi:hypothetical protein